MELTTKRNKNFLKNGVNLKICYNKNKPKLFSIINFYACRWEGS